MVSLPLLLPGSACPYIKSSTANDFLTEHIPFLSLSFIVDTPSSFRGSFFSSSWSKTACVRISAEQSHSIPPQQPFSSRRISVELDVLVVSCWITYIMLLASILFIFSTIFVTLPGPASVQALRCVNCKGCLKYEESQVVTCPGKADRCLVNYRTPRRRKKMT